MAGRLEEVEEQALRHGKKIIAKLEERVRAMEGDLGKCFQRSDLHFIGLVAFIILSSTYFPPSLNT